MKILSADRLVWNAKAPKRPSGPNIEVLQKVHIENKNPFKF
jgi:hypothetical protein